MVSKQTKACLLKRVADMDSGLFWIRFFLVSDPVHKIDSIRTRTSEWMGMVNKQTKACSKEVQIRIHVFAGSGSECQIQFIRQADPDADM